MILGLRQRHRRIVLVLAVFIPAAFLFGIMARKPAPVTASLPAGLGIEPRPYAAVEWEKEDLLAPAPVEVRLVREQQGFGGFAVEFKAPDDFVRPDLLAYWVDGQNIATNAVPAEARLLGAFASAIPLPLPASAADSGALLLYSLANQEVVAVSKPFALGNR